MLRAIKYVATSTMRNRRQEMDRGRVIAGKQSHLKTKEKKVITENLSLGLRKAPV